MSSIGYVSLPGVLITADTNAYLAGAQKVIRQDQAAGVCGWIVDLRGNTGGDMFPMLLGIQPLVGTGVVGGFDDPTGNRGEVTLTTTAISEDGAAPVATTTPNGVDSSRQPVAVLTGPNTASSGEFVAIVLKGRTDTRSFGAPTHGLATATEVFTLSDGAQILFAVAYDVDRSGHQYPDTPIQPDQLVSGPNQVATSNPNDLAVHTATKWLAAQAGCKASTSRPR